MQYTTESDTELDSEGSEAEFERVLADDEEPTLQVIEEEDVALDLDDLDLEEEDDEGDEEDVENVDDEMRVTIRTGHRDRAAKFR
ncbi:hypothetical protein EV122DRAFT_284822 [Schizophyllum commune]